MIGLTPLQARAMEIIRAADEPVSRYRLSMALGLVRGAGYRIADLLIERGHARLTPQGLVATEDMAPIGMRFIRVTPARQFSDGSYLPAHLTSLGA